jgi:hypothetical protein
MHVQCHLYYVRYLSREERRVAQSEYELDGRGSILDRGRGFFF